MSQMRELRVAGRRARPTRATVAPASTAPKLLDSACLARHGIVEYATAVYQPASRFWLFQGIEAGIFLALALGLGAFAVVWIRRQVVLLRLARRPPQHAAVADPLFKPSWSALNSNPLRLSSTRIVAHPGWRRWPRDSTVGGNSRWDST